ncbi:MAG: hypothetical protein L0Z07_09590 [Planctomycetes bacterium]|nr:hypothetical protein [Planctomycetota bacterium]
MPSPGRNSPRLGSAAGGLGLDLNANLGFSLSDMTSCESTDRCSLAPWYVGSMVAAVAIGWLSARLNLAGLAPVGILPLGIGIALGAAISGLAAAMRVTCRARLVVGTLVFSLVTVAAEHTWLYRDFRRQWHAARTNEPQVALFRPEIPWTPSEYMARELSPGTTVLWAADAALIAGAAIGSVLVWQRAYR